MIYYFLFFNSQMLNWVLRTQIPYSHGFSLGSWRLHPNHWPKLIKQCRHLHPHHWLLYPYTQLQIASDCGLFFLWWLVVNISYPKPLFDNYTRYWMVNHGFVHGKYELSPPWTNQIYAELLMRQAVLQCQDTPIDDFSDYEASSFLQSTWVSRDRGTVLTNVAVS